MPRNKIKVTVLMGGPSSEREVSLSGGKEVVQALDKNKYIVRPFVVPKKGSWRVPPGTEVALIVMHGPYGEDGTIQGFLEAQGVAYTGSGVLASALAMDKAKTISLFAHHGLDVPLQQEIHKRDWQTDSPKTVFDIKNKFGMPCVVKPRSSGSSVGVFVIKKLADLPLCLKKAFREDNCVLVEKYIKGTEVTCGVLDEVKGRGAFALPVLEIVPKKSDFYDYASKYASGGSEHIAPRLPAETIKKIQDFAVRAHLILGCSGMSRTDMIVQGDKIYLLETNTIPGMTPTSLLPQAAAEAGINFSSLLDRIIKAALQNQRQ